MKFNRMIGIIPALLLTLGAGAVSVDLPEIASEAAEPAGQAALSEDSGRCGENVTWTLDDKTGTLIISGTGEMLGGQFFYEKRIKNVIITDGVTSIGGHVFANCTGITSITIPKSVTSIETGAFSGCTALTDIMIPDSVTSIGSKAFRHCTGLSTISVDANNTAYCSVDGVLYNKDQTELITVPAQTSGAFVIPEGVTSICDYAFYKCTGLTSITIPDSVTSIGEGAFSACTGLISITIPDSVTELGFAFIKGCTGLTSITIPEGLHENYEAVYRVVATPHYAFGGYDNTLDFGYPAVCLMLDEEATEDYYFFPETLYPDFRDLGLPGSPDDYILNEVELHIKFNEITLEIESIPECRLLMSKKTVSDMIFKEVDSDTKKSYMVEGDTDSAKVLSGEVVVDGKSAYFYDAPHSYLKPEYTISDKVSQYLMRNRDNLRIIVKRCIDADDKTFTYDIVGGITPYDLTASVFPDASEKLMDRFKQAYAGGLYEATFYDIDADDRYEYVEYLPYSFGFVDTDADYSFMDDYIKYDREKPVLYTNGADIDLPDGVRKLNDGDFVIGYFDRNCNHIKVAAVVEPITGRITQIDKAERTVTFSNGVTASVDKGWRLVGNYNSEYDYSDFDYVLDDIDDYFDRFASWPYDLLSASSLTEDDVKYYVYGGAVLYAEDIEIDRTLGENVLILTEDENGEWFNEGSFSKTTGRREYYAHAWIDGETKWISVETDTVITNVLPRMGDEEIYLNRVSRYTVDENGVYTVIPLVSATTADYDSWDREPYDLDFDIEAVLEERKNKDLQAYGEAETASLNKIIGKRFELCDSWGDRLNVTLTDDTRIVLRNTDTHGNSVFLPFDADTFTDSLDGLKNVQFVIGADITYTNRANLLFLFAETTGLDYDAAAVRFANDKLTMLQGTSRTLTVEPIPAGGMLPVLHYTSSDTSVVTVGANGTVYAAGEGSANVTASSPDGSLKAVCTIVVTRPTGEYAAESGNILIITEDEEGEWFNAGSFNAKTGKREYYAYAWIDGESRWIPVETDTVITGIYPRIGMSAFDTYDDRLCLYTVDDNGIYTVLPLMGAENEDGEPFIRFSTVETVVTQTNDASQTAFGTAGSATLTKPFGKPLKLTDVSGGTFYGSSNAFYMTTTADTVVLLKNRTADGSVVFLQLDAEKVSGGIDSALNNVQFILRENTQYTDRAELVVLYAETEGLLYDAADIRLEKTALTMFRGKTAKLAVQPLPAGGVLPVLTYSSTDPSVVTVDGSGRLTAVGEGSAEVTVKSADGSMTAVCTVTVVRPIGERIPDADHLLIITEDNEGEWFNTGAFSNTTGRREYYVYAWIDGKLGWINVETDVDVTGIFPKIGIPSEQYYLNKVSRYSVDENGVYTLLPLVGAENINGESYDLPTDIGAVLAERENEDRIAYGEARLAALTKSLGNRFILDDGTGDPITVTLTEDTVIVIKNTNEDGDTVFETYNRQTLTDSFDGDLENVQFVISADTASADRANLVFLYAEGWELEQRSSFESKNDRIVKRMEPTLDADGNYVYRYTLFDPYTGTTETAYGVKTSSRAFDAPLSYGLIAKLTTQGKVEDKNSSVIARYESVTGFDRYWIVDYDSDAGVIEICHVADEDSEHYIISVGDAAISRIGTVDRGLGSDLIKFGDIAPVSADKLGTQPLELLAACTNYFVPDKENTERETRYAKHIEAYIDICWEDEDDWSVINRYTRANGSAGYIVILVHNISSTCVDVYCDLNKTVTSSVSLDKTELAMTVGETQTLVLTAVPESLGASAVWTTSAPSVVTVNNGVLTAHGTGTAVITVTADGKKASCYVTVSSAASPVTLKDLRVTDSAGKALSAIPSGTFYAAVDVKNDTYADAVTVILACYDADGRLTGTCLMKGNPRAGQTFEYGASFDNQSGSVVSLKAFVWKGLESMSPLAVSAEWTAS